MPPWLPELVVLNLTPASRFIIDQLNRLMLAMPINSPIAQSQPNQTSPDTRFPQQQRLHLHLLQKRHFLVFGADVRKAVRPNNRQSCKHRCQLPNMTKLAAWLLNPGSAFICPVRPVAPKGKLLTATLERSPKGLASSDRNLTQ